VPLSGVSYFGLLEAKGRDFIVVRILIRIVKTHDFAISLTLIDPDRELNPELSKIPVK